VRDNVYYVNYPISGCSLQEIDTVVFDIRNVLITWDPRWLSSTPLLYTARTTTMP